MGQVNSGETFVVSDIVANEGHQVFVAASAMTDLVVAKDGLNTVLWNSI